LSCRLGNLLAADLEKLEAICKEITEIVERTGGKMWGPTPLPTKRLVLPTRKSPCGEGTKTWRKWELRTHRRLIDLVITDPRVMRELMRIQIPEEVSVEMKLSG
jgi:small subunit ribosomal protein S10